jgi:hypothetical protein
MKLAIEMIMLLVTTKLSGVGDEVAVGEIIDDYILVGGGWHSQTDFFLSD